MAAMYNIEIPYEAPRSQEAKLEMAEIASLVEVKEFSPDDTKAQAIQSQVDKEDKSQVADVDNGGYADQEPKDDAMIIDTTLGKTTSLTPADFEQRFVETVHRAEVTTLKGDEFEKDEDANCHVDFICAAANARALAYGL